MVGGAVQTVWRAALAGLLLTIIALLLAPEPAAPAKPPRAASIAAVARKVRAAAKPAVDRHEPADASPVELRACAASRARLAPPVGVALKRPREAWSRAVAPTPPHLAPTRSPPAPPPAGGVALRL